jgi:hypothetical protein
MKRLNIITSFITILGIVLFAAFRNNFMVLAITFFVNFMIVNTILNKNSNKIYFQKNSIKLFNIRIHKNILYLILIALFWFFIYLTKIYEIIIKALIL